MTTAGSLTSLPLATATTSLVSQWERGEKRPRGASLKLLTLVAKNGLGAVAWYVLSLVGVTRNRSTVCGHTNNN